VPVLSSFLCLMAPSRAALSLSLFFALGLVGFQLNTGSDITSFLGMVLNASGASASLPTTLFDRQVDATAGKTPPSLRFRPTASDAIVAEASLGAVSMSPTVSDAQHPRNDALIQRSSINLASDAVGLHPVLSSTSASQVHNGLDTKDSLTSVAPSELYGDPAELCHSVWRQAVIREHQSPLYAEFNKDLLALPAAAPNLLIYVGKTGSLSLREELELLKIVDQFDSVHVHPVTTRDLKDRNSIAITIRDPLTRTMSAFRFLHSYRPSWKVSRPMNGPKGMQKGFFDCFPSFDAFALALDNSSLCGTRARAALTDPEFFRGHLNKGHCFYVGGILNELTQFTLHIVRQDHHEEDVNRLSRAFGRGSLPAKFVKQAHNNSEYEGINVGLSRRGREILTRHLEYEYYAYNFLLKLLPADLRR